MENNVMLMADDRYDEAMMVELDAAHLDDISGAWSITITIKISF